MTVGRWFVENLLVMASETQQRLGFRQITELTQREHAACPVILIGGIVQRPVAEGYRCDVKITVNKFQCRLEIAMSGVEGCKMGLYRLGEVHDPACGGCVGVDCLGPL